MFDKNKGVLDTIFTTHHKKLSLIQNIELANSCVFSHHITIDIALLPSHMHNLHIFILVVCAASNGSFGGGVRVILRC